RVGGRCDTSRAASIVEVFRDFEAAAAHVADETRRTEEARDDAERSVGRLLRAAEDAHRKSGLAGDRGNEVRAVRGPPRRLGGEHVDTGDAHRFRDGAEAARGLDRAAEAV